MGLAATKSYAGSDYPWRAILPNRAELQKLMQTLGHTVDYPNFKDRSGSGRISVSDWTSTTTFGGSWTRSRIHEENEV